MPINENGFSPRRLPEIREAIRAELESGLGTAVTSNPNTVLGVLLSVFGAEVARQESLNQAGFNNLDIDKAEGVYLDKLVAYIGLRRLPASSASGQLKVWRTGVGEINSAVLFEDTDGERYTTPNGLSHTLNGCSEVLLSPASEDDNTTYSVTINDVLFAYTTGTSETRSIIVTEIADEINTTTNLTATVEGDNLRIAAPDNEQDSMFVSYSRMQILEIATFNFVESINVGELFVDENTITTIITANPALLRCNNPLPFTDGREVETDEQLRARHEVSTQVASVATVPAIRASLRNIPNVVSAEIVENRTLVTDSDGRPAKSYECIVEGGNPDEIADTIWQTKPAGVETFGGISTIVIDFSGEQQVVNWSRPTPVYVHVRVTYTKYDEESFPTNGEVSILNSVLEYGDSLDLGVDVIPNRFIGGIYRDVDGIDSLLIEVGTSVSPSAPAPDSWSTDRISIANNEFAAFASGRVVVVEDV